MFCGDIIHPHACLLVVVTRQVAGIGCSGRTLLTPSMPHHSTFYSALSTLHLSISTTATKCRLRIHIESLQFDWDICYKSNWDVCLLWISCRCDSSLIRLAAVAFPINDDLDKFAQMWLSSPRPRLSSNL